MVIGPSFSICWRNKGITEPEEPNTLPKRTIVKRVLLGYSCWSVLSLKKRVEGFLLNACNTISAKRLVLPIILVGRTALSVEINTKFCTLLAIAACAAFRVLITLLRIPSTVLCSTIGTCLYAAAWYTVSTL